MSGCRTSMVSILNNDDNPSFAVRSAPRLCRNHSSPSFSPPQSEPLPPLVSDPSYARPHAASESPGASPRGTRHFFNPVAEAVQPTSPGSSDGSAYDYISSQSSSGYHPYARQDPRRDPYRYPSRGPAAPRTPPETQANIASDAQSQPKRKNKYPCPYAASHDCSATFTTSGHAARHGKKHTGEKSVHCPICNKAFTRKDNMKQHIRTHRTHSDDLRSTSETETEGRWVSRADSTYLSSSHHRTPSQSTESSVQAPSSSGPHPL
ncbi:hypothetical protein NUU61_007778 [Penicillium alfredii]|uniref:C2H2-type domain-containing protein n=1 Tax=Penicillium alfredii TaxID=1506179 RepID=A0A9W9ERD4_9EURO|nr:uncharacterized protein NUU61_007778 [Penicillium alfredii]KAJ5086471.1 hypothetical protein NUU61_007778 [Penicillium alfredii]